MLRYYPVSAEADEIPTIRITGDQRLPAHRLLRAIEGILYKREDMVLHRPADLNFEYGGARYVIQKLIRPKGYRYVAAMVRAKPLEMVQIGERTRMLESENGYTVTHLVPVHSRVECRAHPEHNVVGCYCRLVRARGQVLQWIRY
jgi:hypothetical protein